jgi:Mrp family chromosome partitioning ATPase
VLGVQRPKVISGERTEDLLGLPLLASIPEIKVNHLERNPLLLQRLSADGADAIRRLRTELYLLADHQGSLGVVAVLSPGSGEGKSTLATSLASSFTALEHKFCSEQIGLLQAQTDP